MTEEEKVLIVTEQEIPDDTYNYYWSAPSPLIGNKLTSYGLNLIITVSWNVMRGDSSGKSVFNPDVILIVSIINFFVQ